MKSTQSRNARASLPSQRPIRNPFRGQGSIRREGPATIIGTYNSGDNKYVMFSDGSIEAQTPGGTFRFQSLDELKEFIAAGGEGSSSASL